MDEVIKGLKTPNRNKILGIEKKTKKTTNEAWTKKIRVAFKELYESLDNNLFYVHWDKGDTTKFDIIHNNDNELRMNILYTLKRISPTKKFQLFIDFNFSKVTQKCSLNEVKLRCVPESKFEQKKPTQK